MIPPATRLNAVQEYYFSKKLREIAAMRSEGKDVLNLGIGSPDLPPHPKVVAELNAQSQLPDTHAYQSYKGVPELRAAFAAWYGRFFKVKLNADSEVLPLIGSKEGIVHIAMSFLEKGDLALVPNPGYPAYSTATKLAGAGVMKYPLSAENGWLPDLDILNKKDLQKVKVMWVNYPNMPTGAGATKPFFEKLIAFAKKHRILVVNDNPYSFILNKNLLSLLSVDGAKGTALELNSLSKSHNMAGWRVGILAGHADLIQTVLKFKSNMDSGMFKPVQLAAAKALQLPQNWFVDLNKIYAKRREKVFELLQMLGCEWEEGNGGMFVWARVPERYKDGYELSGEVLYGAHVFLTPGGIFGSQGDRYIRVSLCAKEEIFEEAIGRIKSGGDLKSPPDLTDHIVKPPNSIA
ncbi:MAG TPA: aminotransferase class I/II-fold pyridoxal phosphate-dependent enzyme [Bacteroidetes bacterium]|nr:aminotransferase class I/II-fold pyridoxal phosphate-dependent enzyme [Bacteroidota bacterium]